MAILGISLDQVKNFINEISELKAKPYDELQQLLKDEKIKKWMGHYIRFLNYTSEIKSEDFVCYRVRKSELDTPFFNTSDLIYPPKDKNKMGRMNSNETIVLYTSLNEFTAISESRIEKDDYFQLTKFKIEKIMKVYHIGMFSDLLFNYPRDTDKTKKKIQKLAPSCSDVAIKEFAALECALMDTFYCSSKQSYLLSSFIAESIFLEFQDVDAIMYPTMLNKFGINFAIKKEFVDNHMKINHSFLNCLVEAYSNGFYKYNTKYELEEFLNDGKLKFTEVKEPYKNNQFR